VYTGNGRRAARFTRHSTTSCTYFTCILLYFLDGVPEGGEVRSGKVAAFILSTPIFLDSSYCKWPWGSGMAFRRLRGLSNTLGTIYIPDTLSIEVSSAWSAVIVGF